MTRRWLVSSLLLSCLLLCASVLRPRASPMPLAEKPPLTAHHVVDAVGGTQDIQKLPVAIDGATHPHLISDALAFRHFIKAVAESDNASESEVSRREALLWRIRLSDDDLKQFLAAVRGVRGELDAVNATRSQLFADSPPSIATHDSLRAQELGVLARAQERMLSSLSEDGVLRLESHIRRHVKSRIKIYGVPPQ